MHGYFVTRPLTLRTFGQNKNLLPVGEADTPAATEVHIPAQNEIGLVREALLCRYPDEPIENLLHMLAPSSFAQVPGLPVTLGAAAADNHPAASQPERLSGQLQALKAAMPQRQHFRLLLHNAFSSNLGDNLVGLTAWRHVLAVLRANLPQVSVDVLLGWHASDSLQRLFRDVDGIDAVLTQGPTLAGMTRYQAMFDTSGLLGLPRYGTMPLVDWYLWWMGLAPADIEAWSKRNQVTVIQDDRAFVLQRLPPATGPRILINPKASVALRSMPEDTTRRLVDAVLTRWPNALVLLLQPLAYRHLQVLDLSADINTIDRLAVVVELADGLLGVDSFTQHLADATETPAVTLFTCIEPGQYPYYPLNESVLLPGARELPAWGQPKVTPQAWVDMACQYQSAWQALDMATVLQALHQAMARKTTPAALAQAPGQCLGARLALDRTRTAPPWRVGSATVQVPRQQRESPLAAVLHTTVISVATQVLVAGDTVALLGAGAGEAALPLASLVGHHGRLVAFEPRRQLHQLLCANLSRWGLDHAETHAVMPDGDALAVRKVNGLYLTDEFSPLSLCNCALEEPVVCWPLDAMALDACRLLAVCSPLPLQAVLRSARQTLLRLRPVVLAGVLPLNECAVVTQFLTSLNYRVKTLEIGHAQHNNLPARYGMVVAEPVPLADATVPT